MVQHRLLDLFRRRRGALRRVQVQDDARRALLIGRVQLLLDKGRRSRPDRAVNVDDDDVGRGGVGGLPGSSARQKHSQLAGED